MQAIGLLQDERGEMKVFQIHDLKGFMNDLFCKETFEGFLLQEASITTFCNYKINGHLVKEYYKDETLYEDYVSWKKMRPYVFDLIKGKKIPVSFQIMLTMSKKSVKVYVDKLVPDFDYKKVDAMSMLIRFGGQDVKVISSCTISEFTMDKTLERSFDQTVYRFLQKHFQVTEMEQERQARMKFRKLDEQTVRCIVDENDMTNFGVTIEDIIKQSQNAQDFFHMILEEAVEQTDFEAKQGEISMQIMNLPQKRLAIILSCNGEEGMEKIFHQMIKDKRLLNEMIPKKSDDNQEFLKEYEFEEEENSNGSPISSWEQVSSQLAIVIFQNLNTFLEFNKKNKLPDKVAGRILKDNRQKSYYVVFENSASKNQDIFQQYIWSALEFGELVIDNPINRAFIKENFELIADSAVFHELCKK